MSGPPPCRFGYECHRVDCWYTHPQGRAVDQQPLMYGNMINQSINQSMPHMNMINQSMPQMINQSMPPMGFSGVTKPIVPGEIVQPTNRSTNQQVCRFGRQCHRSECWFLHPGGRDIDQSTPARSGGIDDYDDALDEFEAGHQSINDTDEFKCPCCNGFPDQCQTPSCKTAGVCACQQDRIDDINEADQDEDVGPDAWKDEWFPASRDCECCKGYVYNCKKSQDKCTKGVCFCKDGEEDVEAVLGLKQ